MLKTKNIIAYFKLRENQNSCLMLNKIFAIIAYFKLRENQNHPEDVIQFFSIIAYFKLRENQNSVLITSSIYIL